MPPTNPFGGAVFEFDVYRELDAYKAENDRILNSSPGDLIVAPWPVRPAFVSAQMNLVALRDRVRGFANKPQVCPADYTYVMQEIAKLFGVLTKKKADYEKLLSQAGDV